MVMFASVCREDVEPTCPYYFGAGTCNSGCWDEPRCITDEPLDGWRARQHNAPNGILLALREIDAGRREYRDWLRDLDENPHFWMRGYRGTPSQYPQYSEDEYEHARRVLTRLASITEGES